jgi:hypothetical protein
MRSLRIFQVFALLFAVISVAAVGIKTIQAQFYEPVYTTQIEIDGTNFGHIDHVDGIDQFASDGYPMNSESSYETIRLSREFVTEPSLYLWAKNRMSRKVGLKDIHLITHDDTGAIVSRTILQLCQPLSWTVEAQSPLSGGFNETIDLAVQKITVF